MANSDRSTHSASRTRSASKTWTHLVWPAMFGVALGTAVFGYLFWSHGQAQHTAEAAADPGLSKPAPEECAIARTALSAMHASGADARWRASLGPLTLKARSQGINPVDVPGYADDEADNLRRKAIADWRGCADMGVFVRGLGWTAMNGDDDTAEVALARPGVSASGDQAKVYEMVAAPRPDAGGAVMLARGPWLAALARGSDRVWRVTTTSELPRSRH